MKTQGQRREPFPEFVDGLPVGAIVRALKGIHYGSVQIIVQDSRVVQIERTEKSRLHQTGQSAQGGDTAGAMR